MYDWKAFRSSVIEVSSMMVVWRSLNLPVDSDPKVVEAVPKTAATVPTTAIEAISLNALDLLDYFFES